MSKLSVLMLNLNFPLPGPTLLLCQSYFCLHLALSASLLLPWASFLLGWVSWLWKLHFGHQPDTWHNMSQDCTYCHKTLQDVKRCHKTLQDVTIRHKTLQNFTRCLKTLQEVTRCLKKSHALTILPPGSCNLSNENYGYFQGIYPGGGSLVRVPICAGHNLVQDSSVHYPIS